MTPVKSSGKAALLSGYTLGRNNLLQIGVPMDGPAHVLQVGALPELATEMLRERFVLNDVAEDGKSRGANLDQIRGIATTGKAEVGRALIASLPKLEIISCLGAGSEGIDTQAAAKHRVAIATTSIVLAGDVADVAMGLILNLARDFAGADRFVRSANGPPDVIGSEPVLRGRGWASSG